MSRTERRTRAQVAASALSDSVAAATAITPLTSSEPMTSFGVARVGPPSQKWFAFKCVDGRVVPLTPLRDGVMRGEGKPNATGRLKMALLKHLGGVDDV